MRKFREGGIVPRPKKVLVPAGCYRPLPSPVRVDIHINVGSEAELLDRIREALASPRTRKDH